MKIAKFISAFFLFSSLCLSAQLSVRNDSLIKIAFGSCNKHNLPQPMWQEIDKNEIDVFIWAGDNIYGDTRNMNILAEKYEIQKNLPEYAQFREKNNIIGTWDDHDYGGNDAGKEFAEKKISRNLALDFLDVEESAEVRNREGMYQSYSMGNGLVQIIILDTRYFRDSLYKVKETILPNFEGDILGSEQWTWLEKKLKEGSTYKLNIIVSSIQVLPEEHPYEKWSNFPSAGERLFRTIQESNLKEIIFISGDRHMAEISKKITDNEAYYEVTSSGLTHVWKDMPDEKNKYRQGEVVKELNFGLITLKGNKTGSYDCMLEIKGLGNVGKRILQFPITY